MKVLLFGATGMVGQGVLRECLLDPEVERVLVVGRGETGQRHEKLTELLHRDFTDFSTVEAELSGHDACFFCLGVSSAGMKEQDYRRVTYDYTLAAARTLVRLNPGMTFIYVSGVGTDSTGKGRVMWARVKGETENALFQLPFKAAYMFRPGFIQPMHGETSKTRLYRVLYWVMGPLSPVLKTLFPGVITTTERVGRAMLRVAKQGAPQRLLENQDINALAAT
ncbi:NAD(P)H-binding protein [Archangium violaceum]|uniref:NAD-dependent epimerase/dehydratase family protein n=1 Tax=Archangium violaceum TaxID=83451 RepID=UPI00193B48DA|nr:NAD-dependent epimerase/dehydratase family protein [Archangium violaceum]QRK10447.1 NAD(P)H-binding protein [Archangium violaceum]